MRATRTQVDQLLAWAEPFPARTWAIEGADGLGYLLAQQLVAAGETRRRCAGDAGGADPGAGHRAGRTRTTRTTPCRSRSTALRHADLRPVRPVGHSEVLRLLAKRNTDIGDHRTRLVCRLHALLLELAPGGIAKEINASDVDAFLAEVTPATPVEQIRYDLAVELLDDIRRLDEQLKASHKRIRTAVAASGTTLTDLFGVGPIIAAMLIGYTGDISRFRNRDHYAAYNGTAPSSSPPAAAPCTGSPSAATATSTTPSTWPRSASSANRTPTAAPTSTARSPRARPRRKRPRAEAPDQQRRLPPPKPRTSAQAAHCTIPGTNAKPVTVGERYVRHFNEPDLTDCVGRPRHDGRRASRLPSGHHRSARSSLRRLRSSRRRADRSARSPGKQRVDHMTAAVLRPPLQSV